MGDNIPTNRRIAKNATFLYLRLLISIIVGLFTSRVVLSTLGIDDYGIYSVVGGIVATMGFLNTSMAGATSRFITVALGQNDTDRLKHTFASSMIIHFGIAISVIIIAETAGLWFLNNKLVMPADRMQAANWVYQFSIISAAIGITQVPYNACIIAHERMEVYAYIEILNSALKLIIVYMLVIGSHDRLIMYGLLSMAVAIVIAVCYRFFCIRHFNECKVRLHWDTATIKPLLSFSGWDLYGNMCVTARTHGTNFLINMFYGVALNAASGIATTVNGIVGGLCTNITQAFRPQIIKCYANGNIVQSQQHINNSTTYTLLLLGCIGIPIITEAEYLLSLWLGNTPDYAVIFCQILIMQSFFGLANNSITALIHATGRIKGISLISGSLFIACLPATYFAFRNHADAQWAYWSMGVSTLLIYISNIVIAKRQVPGLNLKVYIGNTLKCFALISFAAVLCVICSVSLPQSFSRLCLTSAISMLTIGIATYTFFIGKETRKSINSRICSILHLKKQDHA